MIYVPPGGAAGWAQMTSASKLAQAGGRTRSSKRRSSKRSKRVNGTKVRRKAKARKTTNRKLKFGSPAWRKKYMKRGKRG